MPEPAQLLQQANNARRLAAALTDPGAYYVLMSVAAECETLARRQSMPRGASRADDDKHTPQLPERLA
jgi:hypothetical protein